MSQRVLALACRDTIRTALGLGTEPLVCDVTFDGQPHPGCGEWFYAVHPGSWQGQSEDADLEEIFGVSVTVTRRIGFAPKDRWGSEVWGKTLTGLDVKLRKIIVALHHSYPVLNAADATLYAESNTQWGFDEPLMFLGGTPPMPKGADWFSAQDINAGKFANAGAAQTLTFGRAKRCQPIEAMG